MIIGEILRKIVPSLQKERADELATHIRTTGKHYGINTPDVLHEFLANVIHESAGFRLREESLNYSAKRLIQVWPNHFNTSNASQYAFNPRKMAEKIYGTGSIAKSLGNHSPEWGYLARGSGFMQLTGYANHKAFADYIGMPVEDAGKAMRESDIIALDSAMWFFAVKAKLIPLSSGNGLKIVSKRINGGMIGYKDREYYYKLCVEFIK